MPLIYVIANGSCCQLFSTFLLNKCSWASFMNLVLDTDVSIQLTNQSACRARVQTVLLKRKQRTVTRMSLQNSNRRADEKWGVALQFRRSEKNDWGSGVKRRRGQKWCQSCNVDVRTRARGLITREAAALLQVNAERGGQRKRGKVVCPRSDVFLLQNYFVYATVVLLLVLKEKSDDITIWITQISCQWSKISFDIVCYMLEKYNLDKYPLWCFFNWQILKNTNT